MVGRVEAEHPPAAAVDPLEGDGDKGEDKALDPGCRFKAEGSACHQAEEVAVEVVDEGGENHEDGVGLQLGAGQASPAEIIVHTVEAAFSGGPLVVEFHYLPFAGERVVGQYAAVDVSAVEKVGLPVFADCALHDEAVASFLEEGLEGDAGQTALVGVDFRLGPLAVWYGVDAPAQRVAHHGPDVEEVAVAAGDVDNLLGV